MPRPAKREPPPKVPVVYQRHRDWICPDCGKAGCLTPIPHGPSDMADLTRKYARSIDEDEYRRA